MLGPASGWVRRILTRVSKVTVKDTLTIRLDRDAIARAQAHAAATGTDLPGLVAAYLDSLPPIETDPADAWRGDLPPLTRALVGVAEGGEGREAYRRHLLDTHAG